MIMTIKELLSKDEEQKKVLLQEPSFKIEENEKGYKIVTYVTALGDIFNVTFYSKKKGIYAITFIEIMNIIGTNYILNSNKKLIHLQPTQFWTIYKKIEEGKNILGAVGVLGGKIKVNENFYSFPDTNYYFQKEENNNFSTRGVYGIYFREELIYIGSSSTDILERWTQHAKSFTVHSPQNQMYKIQDLDDIEFKLLYEDKEINEMLPIKQKVVSTGTIQFVEQLLIRTLRPRYNIQGVVEPFQYKGKLTTGIDLDYVDIAIKFLTEEDYKDTNTILYNFCAEYGEDALIAVTGKTYKDLI